MECPSAGWLLSVPSYLVSTVSVGCLDVMVCICIAATVSIVNTVIHMCGPGMVNRGITCDITQY